jgi:hypothetical protein
MTNEELIQREAEWLYENEFMGEDTPVWVDYGFKEDYRVQARSLNAMLNGCGVRMLSQDNSDDPETTLVAVDRLPEAKEDK